MKYIKIILFTFCFTLFLDSVSAQETPESKKTTSSVKSTKKKKGKRVRKKTPRLLLKKFSRDSLKIEKSYKKELLK